MVGRLSKQQCDDYQDGNWKEVFSLTRTEDTVLLQKVADACGAAPTSQGWDDVIGYINQLLYDRGVNAGTYQQSPNTYMGASEVSHNGNGHVRQVNIGKS